MPRFLFKLKISASAKVLYTLICDFAREKNYCWPSNKTLAENIPCGLTALKTYMQELVDQKLIKFDYRNGGSRIIRLIPLGDSDTTQPHSNMEKPIPKSDTPLPKSDTPLSESDTPLSESDTSLPESDAPLSESDTKLNGNKNIKLLSSTSTSFLNPQVVSRATEAGADRKKNFLREEEFEEFWNA